MVDLVTFHTFQEVVSFRNLLINTLELSLYTLFSNPPAGIEFTLRVANSLNDRTPSKRG